MTDQFSGLAELLASWQWGDVPTWISSIGGIGALIAATLAARASLSVLKIESGRDQDAEERAARAQAELVAAWLVHDDPQDPHAWSLQVVNGSTIPVFKVYAYAIADRHMTSTVATEDEWTDLRDGRRLRALPPGETNIPLRSLYQNHFDIYSGALPDDDLDFYTNSDYIFALYHVIITFRDASGSRWTRDRKGFLSRGWPEEPTAEWDPDFG